MADEKRLVTDKIMETITATPECWGFKTHGSAMQGQGIPDIICCYKGQFIAIECKDPESGRVSPMQEHELEKIERAGGVAAVVSAPEYFDLILKDILEDME